MTTLTHLNQHVLTFGKVWLFAKLGSMWRESVHGLNPFGPGNRCFPAEGFCFAILSRFHQKPVSGAFTGFLKTNLETHLIPMNYWVPRLDTSIHVYYCVLYTGFSYWNILIYLQKLFNKSKNAPDPCKPGSPPLLLEHSQWVCFNRRTQGSSYISKSPKKVQNRTWSLYTGLSNWNIPIYLRKCTWSL